MRLAVKTGHSVLTSTAIGTLHSNLKKPLYHDGLKFGIAAGGYLL
jgi:hypothetical protein